MFERPGIFITIALVAISSALMMRAFPPSDVALSVDSFRKEEVKGISIRKDGNLFTLNFSQQESVIDWLNRAMRVGPEAMEGVDGVPPLFDMIIINRFEQDEMAIRPILVVEKEYIFTAPEVHPNGYLKDVSEGTLYELIQKATTP